MSTLTSVSKACLSIIAPLYSSSSSSDTSETVINQNYESDTDDEGSPRNRNVEQPRHLPSNTIYGNATVVANQRGLPPSSSSTSSSSSSSLPTDNHHHVDSNQSSLPHSSERNAARAFFQSKGIDLISRQLHSLANQYRLILHNRIKVGWSRQGQLLKLNLAQCELFGLPCGAKIPTANGIVSVVGVANGFLWYKFNDNSDVTADGDALSGDSVGSGPPARIGDPLPLARQTATVVNAAIDSTRVSAGVLRHSEFAPDADADEYDHHVYKDLLPWTKSECIEYQNLLWGMTGYDDDLRNPVGDRYPDVVSDEDETEREDFDVAAVQVSTVAINAISTSGDTNTTTTTTTASAATLTGENDDIATEVDLTMSNDTGGDIDPLGDADVESLPVIESTTSTPTDES